MTAAYTTLISAPQLQALLASDTACMVFDCSFELTQPTVGRQQYLQAHIPGAVYADLDQHLSARHGAPGKDGQVVTAQTDQPASGGRHPLPSRERLAQWLCSIGFSNDMQAIVYDRQGANYCGRLWWMLKWAGHDAVAVLDGGLQAWQAQEGTITEQGPEPTRFQSHFTLQAPLRELVRMDEIRQGLDTASLQTVIDARAGARYRGEIEPLDAIAGHIPGALNRPFTDNIAADGRFKPATLLRAEFEALLAERDPRTVVHQCGSGVSALPNLIAMEVAGLGQTRLFAGSWSEWCSQPDCPVERG